MQNARVAILGSGSWGTALAKIVMENERYINWYIRRQEVIDEFCRTGRNPGYLNAAAFNTSRICFSTDINEVIANSDVLILAIPSPYIRQSLNKVRRSMRRKIIISAVKGMVPEDNEIVTDYLHHKFDVPQENLAVVAGPCHAEEIALERLSYLTIGCKSRETALRLCPLLTTMHVHTTPSDDVEGLEYSSVMKNIYAIAFGICHSLRYGDNFLSVLIANGIQEIQRFTMASNPGYRSIDASG